MLLTPPDVISQTLLAIPMWFLFEIGLLFSRQIGKKKPESESDFEDMSDQEMEDELDKIEAEEDSTHN